MIKTNLNWSVKNLKGMHDDKHTLDFSSPIQRQGGQWDGDRLKKSLLIHSILANYPIPPIYCLKEAINEKDYSYSVLDGRQRLETIFAFLDGRYPLDTETPAVVIEDVTYELGGKYFTDLDIECQQELLRFKFTIYGFEDASDDLIEEIFFRLNNSTPLSKPQKAMPLCGVQNAKFIKSILADKFFSEICQFSALQRRKSDDMGTLLQAMMLLDNRHCDYEYTSISADETMRYASFIKNNYSEEQKEKVFDIVDYLEKAFPESNKMLKKINIPVVMLLADLAMGEDYVAIKNRYRVGPMYFRQWFSYFFDECCDEYKQYCSSGSIKKEKTLKRIEIMEKSFKEYFELEETADTGNVENDATSKESNSADEEKPLQEEDSQEVVSQEEVLTENVSEETAPEEVVSEDAPTQEHEEGELVAQGDSGKVSMVAEDATDYEQNEKNSDYEESDASKPPDAVLAD